MAETTEKRSRLFELVYVAVLLGLLALSIFLMNPHRVAVLDLVRVARAVGMDKRFAEDNRTVQMRAAQRMSQYEAEAGDRIRALTKQMDAASGTEKERLRRELQDAEKQFRDNVATVRLEVQRHRDQLMRTFRERIRPAVEKIARKRRLDVVLDPGSGVSYVNPKAKVDITEDVIEACRPIFTKDLPLISSEPRAPQTEGILPEPDIAP